MKTIFVLERRGHRNWEAVYTCPERWPLELLLKKLDGNNYRITAGGKEGHL